MDRRSFLAKILRDRPRCQRLENSPTLPVMDLLEYQAKDLFREVGIPVLPSQCIQRPTDLKALKIPYPIALKSQVYMGERGRVGGVRFVSNTIDAIAAAHSIFNLPIMGEYPKVLLAEAKYEAQQELYLAIALNQSIRRPVILGSAKGGIDVQTAIDEMQHVVIDQEFSSFYARRLALKMGLQGNLINSFSDIVERMYRLFTDKDLDLVEINPLGVNARGEVMALDGKITVNDAALGRHPALAALDNRPQKFVLDRLPDSLTTIDPQGQIAVLCNGAALTMATMDLISQSGGKLLHYLNIGSETHHTWQPEILCDRLEQGLTMLAKNKQVKTILVNIVGGAVPSDQIANAIVRFLRPPAPTRAVSQELKISRGAPLPKIVVRLLGANIEAAKEHLSVTPALVMEDLDSAIAQLLILTKKRES
ncbi:succinate--CoA ligase subunit beta [Leptolyngbya sp. NIES-2104]|uniref:succinate--CoA ligase subunit beta n=1 Tax=Leptolyngbya sp. NIES-2104 TaxID=1552121 RepID=UPI0021F1388E|nr:succinate--CoA ligase subunit beta [Leptolyngbya sp. NIES-2104]